MDSKTVLTHRSLEDVPLIGTLVLVFALTRLTTRKEHEQRMRALKADVHHDLNVDRAYSIVVLLSIVATVVPILQKTYWKLQGSKDAQHTIVPFMSMLAKYSCWVGLAASIVAMALEVELPFTFVTSALGVLVLFTLVVTYRRMYAEMQ